MTENGRGLMTAIDVVIFPRRKFVTLAHTGKEFSVGCIRLPSNFGIAAWLVSSTDESGEINNIRAIKAPFLDAFGIAVSQVRQWLEVHNESIENVNVANMLESAPQGVNVMKYMNGSQMEDPNERMLWTMRMSRLREVSVKFPITEILASFLKSR